MIKNLSDIYLTRFYIVYSVILLHNQVTDVYKLILIDISKPNLLKKLGLIKIFSTAHIVYLDVNPKRCTTTTTISTLHHLNRELNPVVATSATVSTTIPYSHDSVSSRLRREVSRHVWEEKDLSWRPNVKAEKERLVTAAECHGCVRSDEEE